MARLRKIVALLLMMLTGGAFGESVRGSGTLTVTVTLAPNCVTQAAPGEEAATVVCRNGAIIALVTVDGDAIPAGAQVQVPATGETFVVQSAGQLQVPHLAFPARLEIGWGTNACTAMARTGPRNELVPRIGPVVCVPQTPRHHRTSLQYSGSTGGQS